MILIATLQNLPMPPSVNNCYATIGRKRISSTELKIFKSKIKAWEIKNKKALKSFQAPLMEPGKKVFLNFIFKFPTTKISLKDKKTPKKLDTSNRIKPAEDALCKLLGFDDRWVYRIAAEKIDHGKKEACFDVMIHFYD